MTSMLLTKTHRALSSIPQSPNDLYFPLDTTLAWSYRLTGSYRFPYGLNVSGLYTLLNGVYGQRTYTFRSIPNLSTRSIRLENYGDSAAQARPNLNIRATKRLQMKSSRNLDFSFDAINAFNSNTPWASSYVSGPTFGYATTIAGPRTLRFGIAFSF
jgi:outer membrane receptor protein involved in Fe transport